MHPVYSTKLTPSIRCEKSGFESGGKLALLKFSLGFQFVDRKIRVDGKF